MSGLVFLCCLFLSVSLTLEQGSGSGEIDLLMPLPTTVVIDNAMTTRSLGYPTPTTSGDDNSLQPSLDLHPSSTHILFELDDVMTTHLPFYTPNEVLSRLPIATSHVMYTSTMEELMKFSMTSFLTNEITVFPIELTVTEVAMVSITPLPTILTTQTSVLVTGEITTSKVVPLPTLTLPTILTTQTSVLVTGEITTSKVVPLPTLTLTLNLPTSQFDSTSKMDMFIMPESTEVLRPPPITSAVLTPSIMLIPSQSLVQNSSIVTRQSNLLLPFESSELPLPLTTIVMTTNQRVSSMAPLLPTIFPSITRSSPGVSSFQIFDDDVLTTSFEFLSSSSVFMDPQLVSSISLSTENSVQPPVSIDTSQQTASLSPEPTVRLTSVDSSSFNSIEFLSPLSTTAILQIQPSPTLQASIQPPTTLQTSIQPPSTLQTSIQPTTLQTSIQPPSTLQTSIQPPTTLQTLIQPPSTLQTSIQPPSTLQTSIQPPTTLQASIQPPTTLQTSIQPPTTLQVQQSSMADSQLFPSLTEILLVPSSTMMLLPQHSSTPAVLLPVPSSTVPAQLSIEVTSILSSSQNPLFSVQTTLPVLTTPTGSFTLESLTISVSSVSPSPSVSSVTPSPSVLSVTPFSSVTSVTPSLSVSSMTPSPSDSSVTPSPSVSSVTPSLSVAISLVSSSTSETGVFLSNVTSQITMETELVRPFVTNTPATSSILTATFTLVPSQMTVTMETTSIVVPTSVSSSSVLPMPSQFSAINLLTSSMSVNDVTTTPTASFPSLASSVLSTVNSRFMASSISPTTSFPSLASSVLSTVNSRFMASSISPTTSFPSLASSVLSTVNSRFMASSISPTTSFPSIVSSSSFISSISTTSSVTTASQSVQLFSATSLESSLATTVPSLMRGIESSFSLQIVATPTLRTLITSSPLTSSPALITCQSLLTSNVALDSSFVVIKLALTLQEHRDLSQLNSDKRCGLELALGQLFTTGFKGQTVKRQTTIGNYDADISSVASLSQGSSEVTFFILNGSDPASVQAIPATTVEETFMIINPAQVDSYPILSQPVPVIDTMATPPPGSTPSIIPLAVGLGLAILILLVVSISLLVCLSVVWNRKKKHIVVQSFHQGEPGTFAHTNDFTEYSNARTGIEHREEERNSVSLAHLANGWTEGGNGTAPVHYKPEPQTEQVPAALFERVAHYDTPCPQPSPPVRALRMRFRRSVAPSPSASHKSHSSEDPPRVATPAALRPKPSPPKEEETKDEIVSKHLSKDALRLAEQKEDEEIKARRKATLERLLLQSRQRDTDLRSRGGSRRKKKRGTVVPMATVSTRIRPSTHSGAGVWKRSEPELEAALGDVETSSPVATPVGELPAATTPRPSTKRRLLRRKANKVLPQAPGASTDGYDSTDHYPYGHMPPSRQSRQYRPGRNQRSRPLVHHEVGISGRMSRAIAHDVQRELAWMDTPTGVQLMRIQPILPSQAPVPTYTLPPHPSTHAQLITVQPRPQHYPQRVEKLPTLSLNSQSYTQRQLETYLKIHQDMDKLQLDHTLQASIDSAHNPSAQVAPPISIQDEATPTKETPPTPARQEVVHTNETTTKTGEDEAIGRPDVPLPTTGTTANDAHIADGHSSLVDQPPAHTPPPNLDSSYSSAVNELMQQVFSTSAASQQEMQSRVAMTTAKPDESLDSTQAYVLSRQPMYTSSTPVVAWHNVAGAQAPPTQLYSAPPTHYSTLHPAALQQQLVWTPNANTLSYMPSQHLLSPAQLSQLRGSGISYPPPEPREWVDPFHTPQLPSHTLTRNRTDPFR